jgi:hypothetical protein
VGSGANGQGQASQQLSRLVVQLPGDACAPPPARQCTDVGRCCWLAPCVERPRTSGRSL